MASVTASEFNQNVGAAKRAAESEPVVVTDGGKPTHVLLSIDNYERLSASASDDLVESVRMEDAHDIEFEPARLNMQVPDL